MSITKILSNKEESAESKLTAVAEIVAAARNAYGNSDAVIEVPRVNTSDGNMGFDMLEAEGKVEILRHEVRKVKSAAVECYEQNKAVNLNKKIEELLSVNPFFVNISVGTKFEYI